jgi:hypothetical protein
MLKCRKNLTTLELIFDPIKKGHLYGLFLNFGTENPLIQKAFFRECIKNSFLNSERFLKQRFLI